MPTIYHLKAYLRGCSDIILERSYSEPVTDSNEKYELKRPIKIKAQSNKLNNAKKNNFNHRL